MRWYQPVIASLAERKFVLLAGPRQVGKTTLAKEWLGESPGVYLNWDNGEDRGAILKKKYLPMARGGKLVLDEIHKYLRWKTYLKGLYDAERAQLKVMVTGSARLDLYRKGGTSLFGRHELIRIHPFSLGELTSSAVSAPPQDWLSIGSSSPGLELLERLEQFSGFPEPFTLNDLLFKQRWSQRRKELILDEDLRDLSQVRSVSLVEHLMELLPERAGSLLSLNALREELQVSHESIATWFELLQILYHVFTIRVYDRRISRSLRRSSKLYLWDWSQVPEAGPRFENLVAGHLLKAVQAWTDIGYGEYELFFLRTRDNLEIDFVVTNSKQPVVFIEAKLHQTEIDRSQLRFISSQPKAVPLIQIVRAPGIDRTDGIIRIVSADRFLTALP